MFLALPGICSALATQMVSTESGIILRIKRLIAVVDICITTRMKKLERVCLLAEALAERRCSYHSLANCD